MSAKHSLSPSQAKQASMSCFNPCQRSPSRESPAGAKAVSTTRRDPCADSRSQRPPSHAAGNVGTFSEEFADTASTSATRRALSRDNALHNGDPNSTDLWARQCRRARRQISQHSCLALGSRRRLRGRMLNQSPTAIAWQMDLLGREEWTTTAPVSMHDRP